MVPTVIKCSSRNLTHNRQPLKCPARPPCAPAHPCLRRALTRASSPVGQGQEEGHAGQKVPKRARAEALGLCPGVTTGQHGVCKPGGRPPSRVVVSITWPELSSRSLGRKGAGGLGACESGWEAGATFVLGPQARGPLSPSLCLVPWVARHHSSPPAVTSQEPAPGRVSPGGARTGHVSAGQGIPSS